MRRYAVLYGVQFPMRFYGLVCIVYGLFIGSLTTLYRITIPAFTGVLCGLYMLCFAMVL